MLALFFVVSVKKGTVPFSNGAGNWQAGYILNMKREYLQQIRN